MFNNNLTYQFPKQKVSAEEKAKPYWYTNSIDYIIGLGISMNDRSDTETKIRILHGELPQEFYKKLLILIMLVRNVLRTFLLLYVTMILCLILYVDI